MTRQDAINWCQSKLGQAMDFDGQYGAQCTDFANFYIQRLTGLNPYSLGFGVPGAKDYWNVRVGQFEYIANDSNDMNQLPSPGDIMIYNGNMSGTGGYGHICIVGEAKNVYYDQNYGGMFVKRNVRQFNGHEIGWLSFKGFNQGGDKPMNSKQENDMYQVLFGRDMEHGGSGRTGYQVVMDGRAELDAQRDVRVQAINDLQAQLVSVQTALANEQARPPKEVVKEVEKIVEKIVEVPKIEYVNLPTTPDTRNPIQKIIDAIRELISKEK